MSLQAVGETMMSSQAGQNISTQLSVAGGVAGGVAAGKMTRDNSTSNFLGQWGSMWFSNVDGKGTQ